MQYTIKRIKCHEIGYDKELIKDNVNIDGIHNSFYEAVVLDTYLIDTEDIKCKIQIFI